MKFNFDPKKIVVAPNASLPDLSRKVIVVTNVNNQETFTSGRETPLEDLDVNANYALGIYRSTNDSGFVYRLTRDQLAHVISCSKTDKVYVHVEERR